MGSAVAARLEEIWKTPHSVYGVLSTVNHRKIGKRYLVTAFVFLALGGLEAVSLHGITMLFWYASPVLSGFGNYLVPLLIAPLARFLIVVGAVVCLIVAALVLGGIRRGRGTFAAHAPADTRGGTLWIKFGGVLIPAIVLTITFVLSQRTLGRLPQAHALVAYLEGLQ